MICEYCNKDFESDKVRRFCSKTCSNRYITEHRPTDKVKAGARRGGFTTAKIQRLRAETKYAESPVVCLGCGNIISISGKKVKNVRQQKFCSQRCSAKYSNHTSPNRQYIRGLKKDIKCIKCEKISSGSIHVSAASYLCSDCKPARVRKVYRYEHICMMCNKQFISGNKHSVCCSFSCSGRKAAASQNRRSKNEMLFADMCIDYFGSCNIRCNQIIANGWDADVIIDSRKIAILWNGKWHYEKITLAHSLFQVQTRDKIKIDQLNLSGFKVYVIKDLGGYDPNFVREEFEKFIQYLGP